MRKFLAILAALSISNPVLAATGPHFSNSGGIGAASCTLSGGEWTGGTCPYSINGTTGVPSFGGMSFTSTEAATTATSNLQYNQGGTGSSARSVTSKLQDVVSVKDFPGCDPTGVADSTACIQAALNSGALSVYIPSGTYKFSELVLPKTLHFHLYGDGASTILKQTGNGMHWASQATLVSAVIQTIRDLSFNGVSGTGNTLDTSYVQVIDLQNLLFDGQPAGKSSLYLDGNPIDATYMHDVRATNIRIYNSASVAGKAGIELGPHASDTLIDRLIMNGNFATQYCILADTGAQTTVISNSHPYNALLNIVNLSGSNNDFAFVADVLDNALQDNMVATNATRTRFSNVYFEAINSGKNGLTLSGSSNNSFNNVEFGVLSGTAASAITESGGSSGNKVTGGNLIGSFTNAFSLTGSGSYALGVQGYNNYGTNYSLTGTAQTPQAQNTTTNLGANGSNATATSTAWGAPLVGRVLFANVSVDSTPAAGQTFTFNLQKNGGTIATGVISNGSFTVTLTPASPITVNIGDSISIQSVFSATSGSATPRYSITLGG